MLLHHCLGQLQGDAAPPLSRTITGDAAPPLSRTITGGCCSTTISDNYRGMLLHHCLGQLQGDAAPPLSQTITGGCCSTTVSDNYRGMLLHHCLRQLQGDAAPPLSRTITGGRNVPFLLLEVVCNSACLFPRISVSFTFMGADILWDGPYVMQGPGRTSQLQTIVSNAMHVFYDCSELRDPC